jgi:hypothetical protein
MSAKCQKRTCNETQLLRRGSTQEGIGPNSSAANQDTDCKDDGAAKHDLDTACIKGVLMNLARTKAIDEHHDAHLSQSKMRSATRRGRDKAACAPAHREPSSGRIWSPESMVSRGP